MDQTNNKPGDAPSAAELEDRREALKKLGKFAAYAAPFTLVVSAKAQQGGKGSGGRSSVPAAPHTK